MCVFVKTYIYREKLLRDFDSKKNPLLTLHNRSILREGSARDEHGGSRHRGHPLRHQLLLLRAGTHSGTLLGLCNQKSSQDMQIDDSGTSPPEKLSRESTGSLSLPVARVRFEPLRRSLFAPDWDCLRSVAAAALKAN